MKFLKLFKNKIFIIIVSIVLVGGVTTSAALLKNDKEYIVLKSIVLIENLDFEINSEVTLFSLILSNNDLEIINEDLEINTSVLGKQELIIRYINEKNEEVKRVFILNIIDTTPPVIEFKKELTTTVGKSIDLLKNVKVIDNSNEEIKATVEGEFDFNKVGEYHLKYVAIDSSENRTEEDFVLKVNRAPTNNNPPQNNNSNNNNNTTNSSPNTRPADLTKGNLILVDNKHFLPRNFVPRNLVTINQDYGTAGMQVKSEVYEAFKKMYYAAKLEDLNLHIISAYRSWNTQDYFFNLNVKTHGLKVTETFYARPGHSEHQTGLAIDIVAGKGGHSRDFGNTMEYRWLLDNAHTFGFILRYPNGKTHITGFIYEPWHWRYLGVDMATRVRDSNLTFNEFYAKHIK